MKIVAHRGASGYTTENSPSAIKLAMAMNVDFVEIDIRKTKDGRLVVIHDNRIDKVTNGKGYVGRLYFKTLTKYTLLNGERILVLEDVLNLFRKNFCSKLRIHVKEPGYEDQVLRVIVSAGLTDKVRVIGRRPIIRNFLKLIKSENLQLELGLTGHLQPLKIARELKVIEVSPKLSLLTRSYVEKAHNMGIEVYTWPVNDIGAFLKARELGVDGIITDFPDVMCFLRDFYQRN